MGQPVYIKKRTKCLYKVLHFARSIQCMESDSSLKTAGKNNNQQLIALYITTPLHIAWHLYETTLEADRKRFYRSRNQAITAK